MTGDLLPPLFAAAAITLTYVFCLRPMTKGRGCHLMPQSSCGTGTGTADTRNATEKAAPDGTGAEITRLRQEVRLLRHELELRSGGTPAPHTDVRLGKGEPR